DSRPGARGKTPAGAAVLRPVRSSRCPRPVTAERFELLQRIPLLQELLEVRLLGCVHALAAPPFLGVDQLLDFPLDTVAQGVRVHGIELPALVAIATGEPLEARVFTLLAHGERLEVEQLLAGERDALERDVVAAVLLEALRQILFGHEQARRIV